MFQRPSHKPSLLTLLLAASAVLGSATTMQASCRLSSDVMAAVAKYSPAPTVTTAREAMDIAFAYVREHPGADFAIGSGDSMLPLYHDRAVILTERPAIESLKVGQTVVFMGTDGVPVAHTLIQRTSEGWVTMGLGNSEPDDGLLTDDNYMGVVVKAYQPTGSPILALVTDPEPTGQFYAAN